jgi:hypothetical protein
VSSKSKTRSTTGRIAPGLDRHRDRIVLGIARCGQQLDERAEALRGVGEARLADKSAVSVDHGHVVVAFGPVDSARHRWAWIHHQPSMSIYRCWWSQVRTRGNLIARLDGLSSD